MGPTIRIDDEVYRYLQQKAKAFEDTPNSVLRREFGLDANVAVTAEKSGNGRPGVRIAGIGKRPRLASGRELVKKWALPVSGNSGSVLFHRDGDFYNELTEFPGALTDPEGYVLYNTEAEYRSSPDLAIQSGRTHVKRRGGLSSLAGYVRVAPHLRVR